MLCGESPSAEYSKINLAAWTRKSNCPIALRHRRPVSCNFWISPERKCAKGRFQQERPFCAWHFEDLGARGDGWGPLLDLPEWTHRERATRHRRPEKSELHNSGDWQDRQRRKTRNKRWLGDLDGAGPRTEDESRKL